MEVFAAGVERGAWGRGATVPVAGDTAPGWTRAGRSGVGGAGGLSSVGLSCGRTPSELAVSPPVQ